MFLLGFLLAIFCSIHPW